MPELNTLEAALGFIGGVVFITPIFWAAMYKPMKQERDVARDKLDELTTKILRKAGVFSD